MDDDSAGRDDEGGGVKPMPKLVEVKFIDRWLLSKRLPAFDRADTYPREERCPPNVYNLWTPFVFDLPGHQDRTVRTLRVSNSG